MRRHGRAARRPSIGLRPEVEAVEPRCLLTSGIEGSNVLAVAGVDATLTVATFRSDASLGFSSATINWGDGSTATVGTVNDFPLANATTEGGGDITGDHSYQKPGSYTITVTVQESGSVGNGQTATVTSTANVESTSAHSPIKPGHPLSPVVVVNQAFQNLTVADFYASLPNAAASDFTATIDWGDGSPTTTGTVVQEYLPGPVNPGGPNETGSDTPATPIKFPFSAFTVTGSHTYTTAGSDTATITISDSAGDTATVPANFTVAASPLQVQPITDTFQAITGVDYSAIPLAGFTDLSVTSGSQAASSDYTATVDWGDGTTTAGTITGAFAVPLAAFTDPATFEVTGEHNYAATGTYTVQVTISDQAGDSVNASRTIDVSTLSLSATGQDVSVMPGSDQPIVVASLTTTPANANVPSSDYTVTIDWGDGTTSAGTVFGADYPPGPPIEGATIEGTATNGATIANTPLFPITGGGLEVGGKHSYAKDGTYTIQVTIAGPGGASATATSTATVGDIAAQGISFSATTNQADTNQTVAEFHSSNTNAAASDFTATIDWGDGSTSAGMVTADGFPILKPGEGATAGPNASVAVGSAGGVVVGPPIAVFLDHFRVSGDHTYTTSGTYTVHVTISDPTGSTVTTTATATASADTIVAFPLPVFVTPGQSGTTLDVASFHDQAGLPTSDFTVTIDWGDGSSVTSGTVVPGPVVDPLPLGSVSSTAAGSTAIAQPLPPIGVNPFDLVTGAHTYASAGQYTIKVTITSTLGASATVNSTANVGTPPPPVTPPGPPVPGPTPVVVGKHHPKGKNKGTSAATTSSKPVVHASTHHTGKTTHTHTSSHVHKGSKSRKR